MHCTSPYCTRPILSKSLCRLHYRKQRKAILAASAAAYAAAVAAGFVRIAA